MKRWWLPIIVVAVFVCAGDARAGEISFGFKAGLNAAGITETPEAWIQTKGYNTGLVAGAVMVYQWENGFALQPEILYTQKGLKTGWDAGVLDLEVDMYLDVNYIEIPLLAKYTFQLDGRFKPNICAGPSFAYTLSSELEAEAGIISGGVDFSSLTHVTDFGLIAGAGFGVEAGAGVFTFDARYYRGFTTVILTGDYVFNGDPMTFTGDDFENQGFSFLVGYLF